MAKKSTAASKIERAEQAAVTRAQLAAIWDTITDCKFLDLRETEAATKMADMLGKTSGELTNAPTAEALQPSIQYTINGKVYHLPAGGSTFSKQLLHSLCTATAVDATTGAIRPVHEQVEITATAFAYRILPKQGALICALALEHVPPEVLVTALGEELAGHVQNLAAAYRAFVASFYEQTKREGNKRGVAGVAI